MDDKWTVAAIAALLAVAAAAVAHAGARTDRVQLAPNAPGIRATAALSGSDLSVVVTGVRPGARVQGAIGRFACSLEGYGARRVGGTLAESSGRAAWSVRVTFAAEWRDGRHVLAVVADGATVACGALPAAAARADDDSRPYWGIRTFTAHAHAQL
jgi:hypothetical protein